MGASLWQTAERRNALLQRNVTAQGERNTRLSGRFIGPIANNILSQHRVNFRARTRGRAPVARLTKTDVGSRLQGRGCGPHMHIAGRVGYRRCVDFDE